MVQKTVFKMVDIILHYLFPENKCPDPGNIRFPNGNVTFSDKLFEEFTTVSFECNEDYELIGEKDSVCLKGRWSSRKPFCRSKIKHPERKRK